MDIELVRGRVAELAGEAPESIGLDDNLFELGLDSIQLMRLAGEIRRTGVKIGFAELAANPTLRAWGALTGSPVEELPEPEYTGDVFPLGLMQHAYWVGRDSGQPLGGVAAHLYVEFDGEALDPERLRAALRKLVARHDMLRVRLTDNGEQLVAAEAEPALTVHSESTVDDLAATRSRLSHQLMDIEAGQVFTAELSRLPGGGSRLHFDIDMVAADAVSYRLLLSELAGFYADPSLELPPIGYSYRRYRLSRPQPAPADVAWWQERLPRLPLGPALPAADGATPAVKRRHFTITPAEYDALRSAARRRGLTPAAVLAAAFAEVIGRWSASQHFLLNVPLFDRDPVHPDITAVAGDFSNSILVEIDLREPRTFADLAAAVQSRMHADAAHASYPGLQVLRDLGRRERRQVLAPVVFTSALNLGDLFDDTVRRTFGSPVWIISQGPQVLLDAQVTELDGGVLVNWDSREERFPDGVLDEMFAAFERLAVAPDWDKLTERRAHTVDQARAPERQAIAPRTDLEKVLALVFAEVLNTGEVSVTDDLFALGGDSVMASTIVARIRDGLDTTAVTVRTLFSAPTVAELAGHMLAAEARPGQLAAAAEVFLEIDGLTDSEVLAQLEA
ncbi:phosphopantetheine-binding protein [Amycolatopsis sp. cg5]|uniref:phosphopantetheine-binding protein n=1 Tax=Amycolatopsis sp. cg5 TaxID=3238802 RepID=UPI0035252628